MKISLFRNPSRFSFSLVESLVVVSILAILVALLLPAIQKTTVMIDRMRDASNLRQIGLALANYVNEHDQTLPGPMYTTVYLSYSTNQNPATLACFLEPYFGLTITHYPATNYLFFTPLWKKIVQKNQGNNWSSVSCHILNAFNPIDTTVTPWGRPNSSTPLPHKMTYITNAAATYALIDVDQQLSDASTASWLSTTPSKPIYGNVRNALFFDWHVEGVPVSP
jgi:prepilin-type processing-associated H-X9-DG protein